MEIAPAIIPNYTKVNIAGPWSDIWSFGVLVMNMLYGTNQRQLTKEVTITLIIMRIIIIIILG